MYSWQIDQIITAHDGILRRVDFEFIADKEESPCIKDIEPLRGDKLVRIITHDGYDWTVYICDGNKQENIIS